MKEGYEDGRWTELAQNDVQCCKMALREKYYFILVQNLNKYNQCLVQSITLVKIIPLHY